MTTSSMRRIWIPQAVVIVMLAWAFHRLNPYGYYVLLRLVCCALFIFLTSQAFKRGKQDWTWIFGVLAVIYNPIIYFRLGRDVWSFINAVTIAVALASIFVLKPKEKEGVKMIEPS